MTRSVEIPERAVEVALAIYLANNAAGAERDVAMRGALEAALPYLAPAASYLYDCETCGFAVEDEAKAQEHRDDNPTHAVFEKDLTLPAPAGDAACDHSESLYGRCTACGKTWEQQAEERAGDGGLREALGQAWDDGNAVGLDGYVGPGRGAGEVDPEAERARERVLDKLDAHPAAPAGPQPADERPLRAALEKYFSNGGPDTPIRTTWHDGVEHWEAPAEDIRELIEGSAVPQPVDREALLNGSEEKS